MQSLYEKDKMFALQYITATDGLKISYCTHFDKLKSSVLLLVYRPSDASCYELNS